MVKCYYKKVEDGIEYEMWGHPPDASKDQPDRVVALKRMKTKYKYIEFEWIDISKVWLITNWKYKEHIGQLNYISKWKQWELVPYEDTGWTMDCLADIISFVKQLKATEQV